MCSIVELIKNVSAHQTIHNIASESQNNGKSINKELLSCDGKTVFRPEKASKANDLLHTSSDSLRKVDVNSSDDMSSDTESCHTDTHIEDFEHAITFEV